MEKINSAVEPPVWIAINHASDIAAARRAGQRLAQQLGFDDLRSGRLAIIITEAATNMLKHAGDGQLQLSIVRDGDAAGIDVLAFDRGPGIGNLEQALRDGVSSAGTAGTGLGALRRLSDQFDAYAPRGKGSAFFMRLWSGAGPAALAAAAGAPGTAGPAGSAGPAPLPLCGGVCLPLAGESASGDAWVVAASGQRLALMVVDGLGHGPEAAKAASAAVDTLVLQPGLQPSEQIEVCHVALRPTRGAALAIALLDPAAQLLHFAGVGNISACIVDAGTRRQLVSHNGIVGHNLRKVQQFSLPCPPGALVILASDGINTQWDLEQYYGLSACAPALIAAVLLRDFARSRDDASVLVQRCPQAA
jgi:anti-sigma regulatory factor (Ser/Thr protein kinase)